MTDAFQLIEHVHAYKPLLTRVKKEYDDMIHAIEKGREEAGYLNDKIQTMAQEPSTLRNYRRRCEELARRYFYSLLPSSSSSSPTPTVRLLISLPQD